MDILVLFIIFFHTLSICYSILRLFWLDSHYKQCFDRKIYFNEVFFIQFLVYMLLNAKVYFYFYLTLHQTIYFMDNICSFFDKYYLIIFICFITDFFFIPKIFIDF
jgi:hypothetical protein